ncbi:MAG: hypothetical protein Ta2F_17570 [Termitinemataceae bacterium]|nr:MAG: hypothetical protein Ta2F_17570 [Termitinemataceae bacterium]
MQNIVLMLRENEEGVVGVSVYLCNTLDETLHFCKFANKLKLANAEHYRARRIRANKEYSLSKQKQFLCEDMIGFDDRFIQKILRGVDSSMLVCMLSVASDALQEKIFRNMSRRASQMIKEDMEFMGPVSESDLECAKQQVEEAFGLAEMASDEEIKFSANINNYAAELYEKDKNNDSLPYNENSKENYHTCMSVNRDYDNERSYFIIVFSGHNEEPSENFEQVAVYLFETYKAASSFRDFINKMKTPPGTFYYARFGEQMVEYEITKPICTDFDKIFDFDEYILSPALLSVDEVEIFRAIRICDAHKRERIINMLPPQEADSIRKQFESLNKNKDYRFSHGEIYWIKHAQRKILKAVIAVSKKEKRQGYINYPYPQVFKA